MIYMAKHNKKEEQGEVKFNDPKTQAAFERFVEARTEARLKAKRA